MWVKLYQDTKTNNLLICQIQMWETNVGRTVSAEMFLTGLEGEK